MKFTKGDLVRFKNRDAKYTNCVFEVNSYIEDDEFSDLAVLVDKHGRILHASDNAIESLLSKMEYEGCFSTPEYDEESECYHGHLEGIKDLVTWEAETLEDCEKEFHLAVDDYMCFKAEVLNEEM